MSKVFFLRIEMGNDAMQSSIDIANALCSVAGSIVDNSYVEQVNEEDSDSEIIRGIRDENGNTVGEFKIV